MNLRNVREQTWEGQQTFALFVRQLRVSAAQKLEIFSRATFQQVNASCIARDGLGKRGDALLSSHKYTLQINVQKGQQDVTAKTQAWVG